MSRKTMIQIGITREKFYNGSSLTNNEMKDFQIRQKFKCGLILMTISKKRDIRDIPTIVMGVKEVLFLL